MKQNGRIVFNQNILNAIPKDVLDDVPEHKTDEFHRGVLLYLSKETPELYQKAETTEDLSEKLHQQFAEQIRKFAEFVKAKKRNGGIKNAKNKVSICRIYGDYSLDHGIHNDAV